MDIECGDGAQILLDACAETLETFLFSALDLDGEDVSLKGVQVASTSNKKLLSQTL